MNMSKEYTIKTPALNYEKREDHKVYVPKRPTPPSQNK